MNLWGRFLTQATSDGDSSDAYQQTVGIEEGMSHQESQRSQDAQVIENIEANCDFPPFPNSCFLKMDDTQASVIIRNIKMS